MKKLASNKWVRAAIPALLLHCSIGTVYCWSLLKADIAEYIGRTNNQVEWAFSLAIFFLGMSAAFAGGIQEGTIIEMKVTKPDGTEMTTNLKVNQSDLELLQELREAVK